MVYNLNGKTIHIPDEEITKNMAILDLTQEEAIQMWLEDNDFSTNEEVEALTEKAKVNKISRGAKSIKENTPKKARERKPDIEKEDIIHKLADFLTAEGYSVTITNKSKIIEFEIGETHYKLDLIRQRPQKKT